MEVLITSKTKWGDYCCIGGVELRTGKFVRLLTSTGQYQPLNSPFSIGQVWDLTYSYHPDTPPHVEDVRISKRVYKEEIPKLQDYITTNFSVWEGDYKDIFDGKINWTMQGSGYVGNKSNLPLNSVGFWVSDRDLTWDQSGYYVYKKKTGVNRKFRYKGFPEPVQTIKQGTLIRLSLAKWWSKYGLDRCYLQLSGWY